MHGALSRMGLGLSLLAPGVLQAASCAFTVAPLDFGALPQLIAAPVDSPASIQVSCTAEAADLAPPQNGVVSYSLSLSTGGSADYQARVLAGAAADLPYNVFSDPGHSQIWGDGSNGSQTVSSSFSFNAAEVAVMTEKSAEHLAYGRIPPPANVPAGDYSDSITVTLSF